MERMANETHVHTKALHHTSEGTKALHEHGGFVVLNNKVVPQKGGELVTGGYPSVAFFTSSYDLKCSRTIGRTSSASTTFRKNPINLRSSVSLSSSNQLSIGMPLSMSYPYACGELSTSTD